MTKACGSGWRMMGAHACVLACVAVAAAAAAPTPDAEALLRDAEPRALQVILDATSSEQAELRANAVEAAQAMPARALPIAQIALEDPNAAVRFTALVTIGKLGMEPLGDAALRMTRDRQPFVRAAALYAAKRCGKEVNPGELAALLASSNPSDRSNAAMLLGMMGDKSAIPMLQDLANAPMRRVSAVRLALVRVQVAEAIVLLGDDSALDVIRAGAYSPFDEVRVLSVQMLGRLEDQRMAPAIAKLLTKNPLELRLAAAEAMLRMGHAEPVRVALELCDSELATIRAQCTFVLRLSQNPAATEALVALLDDPDPRVCLAAAAGVMAVAERRR